MNARIESETVYAWWCEECNDGQDGFDSESYANTAADAHDDERHPEVTP